MAEHWGAGIVGNIVRRLPSRRWQAGHWLGKLLVPRTPFIGRFRRGLFEVHPGEVASMSAFLTGFYEREVTMWSEQLLRTSPPSLVIDVGANFGYYPLLFGLLSDGKTESIAFEPDPANFAWLSRNVALNPALKVTAVQLAVGDTHGGTVPFETSKDGCSVWSRVGGNGNNKHAGGTIEVRTATLDAFLDERHIETVPLTLIDVEGFESRVLQGMSRGIDRQRYTTAMVEFHPWAFPDPETEIRKIADRFLAAGYSGRRFRHFDSAHSDKDADYYRLGWDGSLLAPLQFDKMSSWEHFLFSVDEAVNAM